MRDKIRSYDDPANFDITNCPSPGELTVALSVGFVLSAIPGAVVLPLLYTWFSVEPAVAVSAILAIAGALIGMGFYFPATKKSGVRKRQEFIDAGGDPSGYSDLQCGVLGGHQNAAGQWQWTSTSSTE